MRGILGIAACIALLLAGLHAYQTSWSTPEGFYPFLHKREAEHCSKKRCERIAIFRDGDGDGWPIRAISKSRSSPVADEAYDVNYVVVGDAALCQGRNDCLTRDSKKVADLGGQFTDLLIANWDD